MSIITISGFPGAGKTTTGKLLAERLGYKFYSMGDLQGKVAREMDITIDELMRRASTDPGIHEKVDEYQAKLGKTEDNFVCDGWLSFKWMPHSYKVMLFASVGVCATRVFEEQNTTATRPDEKRYNTLEEVREEQIERFETVRQTFIKQYGVDITDKRLYDLRMDTSKLSVEQAANRILDHFSIWKR